MRGSWLWIVVCAGCAGQISSAEPDEGSGSFPDSGEPPSSYEGPSGNEVQLRCEGDVQPADVPLYRLTKREYQAAVRELVGEEAMRSASSALALLPDNVAEEEGAYGRQDQRLSDRHIDAYFGTADAVARFVASSADAREQVLGTCARGGADDTCLAEGLGEFIARAHRAPRDEAAVARTLSFADGLEGNDRIHAVVFAVLMAPEFLYRLETSGTPSGDRITLSAHELVTRVSFHFWGAPPDQDLLDLADSGELASDTEYRAMVERVYEDERTTTTILSFFEEMLHLRRGQIVAGPRIAAMAPGLDVEGLADEMREEVIALIRHHVQVEPGAWRDVLTSRYSFARDARLAAIYGAEVWNGEGAGPLLPAQERSGLLTRAGMLFTGDGSTNPFRRGAFLRKQLLCDPVAPPPTNLPPDALEPPPVQPGTSTRDAFASKVAEQPCAGCHAQFSDLGYAFEAYDGLGRYRTTERLIAADGSDQGTVAVDSAAAPLVEWDDDREVLGPVELVERMAESDKVDACLARHYFRFTFRRQERPGDSCAVSQLAGLLEEGRSLREALRDIALSPAFRARAIEL